MRYHAPAQSSFWAEKFHSEAPLSHVEPSAVKNLNPWSSLHNPDIRIIEILIKS